MPTIPPSHLQSSGALIHEVLDNGLAVVPED